MFKKILLAFVLIFSSVAFGADAVDDVTINGVAKHAWAGHKSEFPKIKTEAEFAKYIKNMVNTDKTTISKQVKDGKRAYWRDGVFVVLKNGDPNVGSCFKPADGKKYYDKQ